MRNSALPFLSSSVSMGSPYIGAQYIRGPRPDVNVRKIIPRRRFDYESVNGEPVRRVRGARFAHGGRDPSLGPIMGAGIASPRRSRTKFALEPAMTRATTAGVLVALAALGASALRGQNADSATANSRPAPPSPVFSIGQPPIWR